ncbi:metal ABC transporter permease [Candidatus Gottesmanbacteria bacterium]|nr:metal ABC transporter permease [Candidatus Gottesmanbacteria bacterium]
MLEIFQYSFMVRAFIAGIVIGIIAPLIGNFLVARRYSLMADSLSHMSLAGVAIGLITGIYPIYTAMIVAVAGSIAIELLRTEKRISGEVVLAMFLSGSLAIAIVLISFARGFNVDLFSYLFGSISTVREIDLWIISGLGLVVLTVIFFLYKELVYIAFDEEAAKVSGVKVRLLNIVLVILTAVTVSLSMRIVGALLIGALMVIPVVAAMQLRKSFKQTVLFAIMFGLISVISGLFISYYLNLAAGGTIVVLALALFGVTIILNKSN